MEVLCDDVTTIFVDGREQKHVDGTKNWQAMATLNIPASTVVVGIKCHNNGGDYGIKVSVQNSDGEDVIESQTDNYWKCSNDTKEGWSEANFDENDSWEQATNIYQDNWPKELADKNIFWTSRQTDATVYCRITLPTPPPGRTTSFRNI